VFGKRIIVVGGGAQVAQVALGAVSEADRHNLRGERISVDTIPLVGEEHRRRGPRGRRPAARQAARAGRLDHGRRHQRRGRRAARGRHPDHRAQHGRLDHRPRRPRRLDPVQAGTMAVMAVADTAGSTSPGQRGRRY
jgi:energy-converting hydrogenase B subunit Q